MNRFVPLLLATGLAATLIGCQSASDPGQSASTDMSDSASSDYTLVTLTVPNMT